MIRFFMHESIVKVALMASSLVAMVACNASVPVVTLTFDDNPKGHFTVAAPVLERYGYRGTFNVITHNVGADNKMSWGDIRELRLRGHEITSHTVSHVDLVKLLSEKGSAAVVAELEGSRDAIRRETGAAPRFLCHPFVRSNSAVEALVRKAGLAPMLKCRRNFGTGTTPTSFAAALDELIAKGGGALDLMFHGITKETGGWRPLASVADFEGCIAALAEREKKGLIRVVDYATFAGLGRGTLCLTFDDRNWERWTAAMPIFEKYGARASFFPNGILDAGALSFLKKLYDAGHTIGVHTVNHLNAPDAVAAAGFDVYWEREIAPQMSAFESVGIVSRSMAYPNNRRSDETDAALAARGITRLRAGVAGARPYDPEGKKRLSLVTFPKLDAMYLDAETVRTNGLMRGVGIGSAYGTDIDDLCEGLRRAAARNETVVLFSHDIAEQPNRISMRTEWLEKILMAAKEEGMSVIGFDDLPPL